MIRVAVLCIFFIRYGAAEEWWAGKWYFDVDATIIRNEMKLRVLKADSEIERGMAKEAIRLEYEGTWFELSDDGIISAGKDGENPNPYSSKYKIGYMSDTVAIVEYLAGNEEELIMPFFREGDDVYYYDNVLDLCLCLKREGARDLE